jgi:hypothetical protein
MVDPTVSLATLRLGTQLVLAGADDTELDSVRDSYTLLATFAPRSWFVALSQNLQAVATKADVTESSAKRFAIKCAT